MADVPLDIPFQLLRPRVNRRKPTVLFFEAVEARLLHDEFGKMYPVESF